MRKQIAGIPALVEDDVLRLFGDAGRAKESSSDAKVISVIRTVVNKALRKGFRSAAFYLAVQKAVHKCVAEHQTVEVVVTSMSDTLAFIVPVTKFIDHKLDKSSFDKARMEEWFM